MVVLELAGGVRGAGKTVAHGFGGEAGDSERLLPLLQRQRCGYRLAKTAAAELELASCKTLASRQTSSRKSGKLASADGGLLAPR